MKNPFDPFDSNPFVHNPYVRLSSFCHYDETDNQFSDRRKIRKDILSRFLRGHSNVVLYGPRGYGKSSIAAELVVDLKKAGIKYMIFDVVKAPSLDLFVSSYAKKVHTEFAPNQFEFSQTGTFLKILKSMNVNLTTEPIVLRMVDDEPISPEALAEVLDLPQKLLSGKDRAVVVFDEFQELSHLLPNDRFEHVMQSVIRSHRNVAYLFLGSHYRIVQMFTDPIRPLYKSAEAILLDKPPTEECIRFVIDRFARTGKMIDRIAAENLVARARNIPCFIQQLGFETFRLVHDKHRKYVWKEDVATAAYDLVCFNRNHYEQLMLTRSWAQRKLLVALACESPSAFDRGYRRKHALGASSTVSSACAKLKQDGLIEFSDGYYCISDPFFAWFLRLEK